MSIFESLDAPALAQQLRDPSGAVGVAVADALGSINRDGNAMLVASLALGPDDQVLEVGCGLATMAPAIVAAAPGIRYTGLDRSPTMVDAARDRHDAFVLSSQVRFECAEVERMPFAGASFDKVFSAGVIHFWSDPVHALTEVRRVLRPGARMAMGAMGPERAPAFARPEYGFHLHDADAWQYFCRDAGFAEAEVHSPATADGPQGIVLVARA